MSNQDDHDKVTNVSEPNKNDENIVNVKSKIIPFINYKLNPILSASILNYLAIGISLAIIGLSEKEFLKLKKEKRQFYLKYHFVSGIILYISGIFDWFEGKELLYLIDFILSFYFLTLFFEEDKPNKILINDLNDNLNDKLNGTFYVILFLLFLCITISYKDKGKFFIAIYAVLVLGFIFLFLFKYFDVDWMKDAYSYIFIIDGILFWIAGLMKMIDNIMNNHSIVLIAPTD